MNELDTSLKKINVLKPETLHFIILKPKENFYSFFKYRLVFIRNKTVTNSMYFNHLNELKNENNLKEGIRTLPLAERTSSEDLLKYFTVLKEYYDIFSHLHLANLINALENEVPEEFLWNYIY